MLTKLEQLSDEHADTQAAVDGTKGALSALHNLKHKNPKLKTVLSIGGGGKGSDPFAGMAHSAKTRENFAISVKETLDKYGFDGVDSKPKLNPQLVSLLADSSSRLGTPIRCCSRRGLYNIVADLTKAFANTEIFDHFGSTMWHMGASIH